ncbi:MAG: fatty acid metabolism transcriptional regulator FadR [Chloroflexota bacterium]|nr:fatty acid metabolism transcriptional regulator FadR [Chloroflexota bacterium]
MRSWKPPQRPAQYAEQALVNAILDDTYAPGTALPGERDLAASLGVTRPTLREALQRLARDGWLTIQQGKPTTVNDFWREGGLNVLGAMVRYGRELPPDFVPNLLKVRLHLAPAYSRAAVSRAPGTITRKLSEGIQLDDNPVAFARFDWELHHLLTIESGNPIYTLILNGFAGFYEQMACQYFALPEARAISRSFYESFQAIAINQDADSAEEISRQVMQQTILLWQQATPEQLEVVPCSGGTAGVITR